MTIERELVAAHQRRRSEQRKSDDGDRADREQPTIFEVCASPRDRRRGRNEARGRERALLGTTTPEQVRDERSDDERRNQETQRDEEPHVASAISTGRAMARSVSRTTFTGSSVVTERTSAPP